MPYIFYQFSFALVPLTLLWRFIFLILKRYPTKETIFPVWMVDVNQFDSYSETAFKRLDSLDIELLKYADICENLQSKVVAPGMNKIAALGFYESKVQNVALCPIANPSGWGIMFSRSMLNYRYTTDEVSSLIGHEIGHFLDSNLNMDKSLIHYARGALFSLIADLIFFIMISDRDEKKLVEISIFLLATIVILIRQQKKLQQREFDADKVSAHLTGKPEVLISTLSKIKTSHQSISKGLVSSTIQSLFFVYRHRWTSFNKSKG